MSTADTTFRNEPGTMRIIPVSDFDSPELDVFARVTEPQMRERGILLAETASVIQIGRAHV